MVKGKEVKMFDLLDGISLIDDFGLGDSKSEKARKRKAEYIEKEKQEMAELVAKYVEERKNKFNDKQENCDDLMNHLNINPASAFADEKLKNESYVQAYLLMHEYEQYKDDRKSAGIFSRLFDDFKKDSKCEQSIKKRVSDLSPRNLEEGLGKKRTRKSKGKNKSKRSGRRTSKVLRRR